MSEYNDSSMIALLPVNSGWAKIPLPHLTLVYAGKISELKSGSFNEMGKAASIIALLSKPLILEVIGTEVFGDEEKVDVLTLKESPEIMAMRGMVDKWNASEHPFRPHVTVGPVGSVTYPLPETIYFNRVYLSYGTYNMTFNLTS